MVKPANTVGLPHKSVTALTGERRQITALFYDIVGSTDFLQRLDPEDFALLQRRVHNHASAAIRDNGGYFGGLQGDGGSAFFGFPVPTEDAAECAVASALALVELCDAERMNPALQGTASVRVGIATGTVVISDADEAGLPDRKEFIGVAPTLAARLQLEAEPNSVAVSEESYRLTRDAFEFSDMGERRLKGFVEPVRVWRPLAARPRRDRFSASHSALHPLVARTRELDSLRQHWANGREGHGQVVVVSGEPGIGKSRLVAELQHEVTHAGFATRVLQCQPRGNTRPLHPFIDSLRSEIRGDIPGPLALAPEEIHELLRAADSPTGSTVAALSFLSGGNREPVKDPSMLAPSDQEALQQAVEAAVEVIRAWSHAKPLLVVIEDIHWADTLTEAVLDEIAGRIARSPILVILTTRARPSAHLVDSGRALPLSLTRLSADETTRLLEDVWGGALPPGLAAFIQDKSDGVPLFVEELGSLIKERLGDAAFDGADWNETLRSRGVINLQDLLSARLSGLGKAQRIAQVASVIGREFRVDLLARLIDDDTAMPPLRDAMAQLREADVVRRRNDGDSTVYTFRHVLLQEAAYESLLKSDRRKIHGRIADLVIEGAVSAPPDEIVAWHCEQADRVFEAASYSLRAAEACALRSATREADKLLAMADRHLARCEPGATVDELFLQLLAAQGPVAIALYGKGSTQAREIYERGVALCRQRERTDRERWFPLYWGWWYTAPDRTTKRSRSLVLIEDLDQAIDPEIRLQAFHCGWAANFHAGQLHLCLDCIEKGLKLYDPERARVSRIRYGGHDANVCGLGERAQLLWLMGDSEGSAESIRRALDWADQIDHPGSRCHVLDNAVLLASYRFDRPETLALALRLRTLADAHDLPEVRAKSRIFAAWAAAAEDPATALREFEEGLRLQKSIGSDEDAPVYHSLWAELLQQAGRTQDALAVLDTSIEAAEGNGNIVWLPELHRLRALVRRSTGQSETACRDDLERAVTLADRQGSAALSARARMDLELLLQGSS